MPRSWLSVRVDLVSSRGEDLWPRPGRILAAARAMTVGQLAAAIDDAFGRWDVAHRHTVDLTDGTLLNGPGATWEDPPQGRPVARSDQTKLSRLALGEQFAHTFDLGDDWTTHVLVSRATGRVEVEVRITHRPTVRRACQR